jgi:hypothetical protein
MTSPSDLPIQPLDSLSTPHSPPDSGQGIHASNAFSKTTDNKLHSPSPSRIAIEPSLGDRMRAQNIVCNKCGLTFTGVDALHAHSSYYSQDQYGCRPILVAENIPHLPVTKTPRIPEARKRPRLAVAPKANSSSTSSPKLADGRLLTETVDVGDSALVERSGDIAEKEGVKVMGSAFALMRGPTKPVCRTCGTVFPSRRTLANHRRLRKGRCMPESENVAARINNHPSYVGAEERGRECTDVCAPGRSKEKVLPSKSYELAYDDG